MPHPTHDQGNANKVMARSHFIPIQLIPTKNLARSAEGGDLGNHFCIAGSAVDDAITFRKQLGLTYKDEYSPTLWAPLKITTCFSSSEKPSCSALGPGLTYQLAPPTEPGGSARLRL